MGLGGFAACVRDVKPIMVDGDCVVVHVHTIRDPGTFGFAVSNISPANDSEAQTLDIVRSVCMRNGFASVIAGPGAVNIVGAMA